MRRRAFTLVELLVVISIIGILAGLLLGALAVSAESARKARTESIIRKLDAAIQQRLESYRTRRVSLDVVGYLTANGITASPENVASVRLAALREMMRFEMPQRYADVTDNPILIQRPALSQAYYRRVQPVASIDNNYEAAEMLYLVITSGGLEDDTLGEESIRHEDTADVNDNGLPEFVDGWGNPIRWLRWAPAFVAPMSDLQPAPTPGASRTFSLEYHDPLDTSRVDLPVDESDPATGFRLFPLIYSAGPDGIYDISVDAGSFSDWDDYIGAEIYSAQGGLPVDSDNHSFTAEYSADGAVSAFDNIHNHRSELR